MMTGAESEISPHTHSETQLDAPLSEEARADIQRYREKWANELDAADSQPLRAIAQLVKKEGRRSENG